MVVSRNEEDDCPEIDQPERGRWIKRLNRFLGVMGMIDCDNKGRSKDQVHDHRPTVLPKMIGLVAKLEKPVRAMRW